MIPLNLMGPVYGSSGYASAAREMAFALEKSGRFQLGLASQRWSTGFDITETRERYLKLQALEAQQQPPEHAQLLHWSIASEFSGRQGHRQAIGHCIFETNALLQDFVQGCNRMDRLIVPSQFHYDAFERAGVRVPMAVIPEGVDPERFTPHGPGLPKIPKRFSFLFVSQLSYRKSFDLVLRAFLELFAGRDDVQLLLRCYMHDGSPKDLQQVRDFIRIFREEEMGGLKSGYVYLLGNVADLYMPQLYRSAQVLLAPFRGEGWGLPITEALSSELPVIATAWGGPMAYLNKDIATLLSYQLEAIPQDIPDAFLGGHLMMARDEGHMLAEPDYEQLKYAMWDSYQNYFLHKAKATRARQYLSKHFRWEQAAHKLADWLEGD